MKRNTVIIFVSCLIIAGIYALIKVVPEGNARKSGAVQTDIAALRDLKSVVPATGEVLPLLSSVVKSEISGRITRILIEEGDSVQRGDVLVELDRISLQTRVREAERSFEADRLRLERSKRNYERLSRVDGTLLARNGLDWNAVEPYTQLTVPTVDLDSVSVK